MMKIIKYKTKRNNELIQKLLDLQDPEEITKTINEHWREFWRETEATRYSEDSAVAYRRLKNILKYHLFEKRDGAIINCVQNEDGTIEDQPDQVNEQLLKTLEEIQVDNRFKWIEQKEFPQLAQLKQEKVENIISQLASNKAIAYDGLSNILFSDKKPEEFDRNDDRPKEKSNSEKTAEKLKDLWEIPLHAIEELEDTWNTRLVPLNKVFPNIPTRKEMRPIAVQSPLVKLLEARFLPKLQKYLNKKLDRSQTGFIQKMGIQVNLVRALERITLRTKQNKVVYGLFIDFSNAYNSIPHELLFKKLRDKKVLEEDEITFIEQLYARYKTQIGSKTLKSNKGVAQGSVISPALFNIFIEDLSLELKTKANLDLEDLLYYADDLMTLCTSIEQVKKAIKIIEEWSERNGMSLNKKKSGIVVFAKRRANKIPMMKILKEVTKSKKGKEVIKRKWIPAQKEIEGVPICEKYKYLGTILTPKLTCGEQIAHIRKKSAHIYVKLYPYLQNATADARRDMWQTMVRPLFDATLVLLEYEPSKSQQENLKRLWRRTFKQFLMIKKRISTALVEEMTGSDLEVVAKNVVEECKKQWEQRKKKEEVSTKRRLQKKVNLLRGVPNTWCRLLDTQVALCPKCTRPTRLFTSWHMKYAHGVEIRNVKKVWRDEICKFTRLKKETITRKEIEEKVGPIIQKHLDVFEEAKKKILG